MRLGWRHPRPNDLQGIDQRPLRDTASSLQQFMLWPHFEVAVAGQATSGAFVKRTINMVDDPFSLVRDAADEIQVPRDFDTWMLVGQLGMAGDNDGPCRVVIGWFLNGTDVFANDGEMWTPAGATDWRLQANVVTRVKKGDVLSIAALCTVAGNITTGRAVGFFLPMT